jgi:hypothetical protein
MQHHEEVHPREAHNIPGLLQVGLAYRSQVQNIFLTVFSLQGLSVAFSFYIDSNFSK